MAVLERLPIYNILATGKFNLPEDCSEKERDYVAEQIAISRDEVYAQLGIYKEHHK